MQSVNTRLTRLLGIRIPLICAPMATATNVRFATEVTKSGGFGFVGAGMPCHSIIFIYSDFFVAFMSPDDVREQIAAVRKSIPDLGDKPLPIGIGLIGWLLDANVDAAEQMIDTILESDVQALWFAFGDHIQRWIQYARTSRARTNLSRQPLIFIQVTSIDEALLAVQEWKADVIIAQGTEAGGHGSGSVPSTILFTSAVLASLRARIPNPGSIPPVLAAGGIMTGAQMAAYLALGAAGAVIGTRFLLTPECPYTDVQKAALLQAMASSSGFGVTVRTLAFDYGLGLYGWPAGIDGRAIRNHIVKDVEAGISHEVVRERVTEGTKQGDPEYTVVFCGQGISLVHDIKPVKDVVAELHSDLVLHLEQASAMLQG
ncbi:2-nitropropane dioxygenase [Daedaleopsis nitida]|nr:2-nitropropane dioxygenase [Daedaleopsis nitida]